MSLGLKTRRDLHAVTTKPAPKRTTLMSGMKWDATNNAESHGDVANFLRRQIARGLIVKEPK